MIDVVPAMALGVLATAVGGIAALVVLLYRRDRRRAAQIVALQAQITAMRVERAAETLTRISGPDPPPGGDTPEERRRKFRILPGGAAILASVGTVAVWTRNGLRDHAPVAATAAAIAGAATIGGSIAALHIDTPPQQAAPAAPDIPAPSPLPEQPPAPPPAATPEEPEEDPAEPPEVSPSAEPSPQPSPIAPSPDGGGAVVPGDGAAPPADAGPPPDAPAPDRPPDRGDGGGLAPPDDDNGEGEVGPGPPPDPAPEPGENPPLLCVDVNAIVNLDVCLP